MSPEDMHRLMAQADERDAARRTPSEMVRDLAARALDDAVHESELAQAAMRRVGLHIDKHNDLLAIADRLDGAQR